MKIFVAFGYRPEDAWVKTLVLPMIEAFGTPPVTGEKLCGAGLSAQIDQLIASCDGFIGILTRRDPMADGKFTTHAWVVQEASIARARGSRVLEVRDVAIDPQLGINFDLQRIMLKPDSRDDCIAEIAKVLIEWNNEFTVQPHLLPPEAVALIRRDREAKCTAKVMRDMRNLPEVSVPHFRVSGGAQVMVKNVRRGDMVQIRVTARDEVWESEFIPVDSLHVYLERIP
jgi:hypothetical protein